MLRGDAYLFWRKPHEAIADYDQAERRGGFESQTVVRLHVQRARCRIGIDDNEGAVNDLDAALRIAPGTVSALRWRAVAHERLGNLAQAVADYDALLQIAALSDTTSADVLAERANILLKLKLFARAAADLKQALTYTPGVLENLRRLGYAYEKAGLKDQALSTYRETADLYPGDEWTKRQLARLNRRSR
jgi:tetratricopeptide (TPR) repeat protein